MNLGLFALSSVKQWKFLLDFVEQRLTFLKGDLDILVLAETRPSETKFSAVFLDSRLLISVIN